MTSELEFIIGLRRKNSGNKRLLLRGNQSNEEEGGEGLGRRGRDEKL